MGIEENREVKVKDKGINKKIRDPEEDNRGAK